MITPIAIEAHINAPIEKVWDAFTSPEAIVAWSNASDDWHTTKAENDLKVGGHFYSRMEAKDGSSGFDFSGTYDAVDIHKHMAYTMSDGRKVEITFTSDENGVQIEEKFDPETENTPELQRSGWQAILNNFKKYVENSVQD